MKAQLRRVNGRNKPKDVLPDWTELNYLDDGRDVSVVTFNYPESSDTRKLIQDGAEYAVLIDGKELDNSRFILDETAGNEVAEDGKQVTWSGQTLLSVTEEGIILPRNDVEKQDQVTHAEHTRYRKAAHEWAKKRNQEFEKSIDDMIKDARVDNKNPGDPPTNITKEKRRLRREFLQQYDTNEDGKVDWRDFEPSGKLEHSLETAPAAKPIVFKKETPGEALRWCIHQAKERQWAPKLKIDFNDKHDSNGKKWSEKLTTKVEAGSNILEFIRWLTENGKAEARMKGWTLQLFNPNTGVVRRNPHVTLIPGKNMMDAPRSGTSRELINSVYAKSDNGVHGYVRDPKAFRDHGRKAKEVTLEFEGVKEWDELRDLALAYINRFNKPRYQYNYKIANGAQCDPYAKFNIMDWIFVKKQNRIVQMRVYQVNITWSDDNAEGDINVTLNDVLYDRAITHTRKLRRLTGKNGLTVLGKTFTGSDPRESDGRAPSKPSAPIFASKAATTQIQYDGLDFEGNAAVFDQSIIEVHRSVDPDFQPISTPTEERPEVTLLAMLTGPASVATFTDEAVGAKSYYKFVAIDEAGDRSEPSDPTEVTTAGVTNQDLDPSYTAPPPAIDDLSDGTYNGQMFVAGAITTRAKDPLTGLLTGPGQTLGPSGMFSYGPVDVNGNEQRRMEMPTDPLLPHVFRGDAFIDRLTVGTFTALAESSLAENAVMTLLTGITAPTNAPTVSFEWNQVQLTVAGEPFDATNVVGVALVGTTLWVSQTTGDTVKAAESWLLWTFDLTTGAAISDDPWLMSPSFQLFTGSGSICTTDGTDLWMLWWEDGSGASGQGNSADWYLTKYDISGGPGVYPAQVGKYLWSQSTDGEIRQAAVQWDAAASELVIAQSLNSNADKIRFHRYSIPAGAGPSGLTRNSFINSSVAFASNFPSLLVGSYDFGASRYVINNRARTIRTYDSTGVETADFWPPAGDQSLRGIWHDGTLFRSLDSAGIVSDYEMHANLHWTSSALDTWYLADALRFSGGPYETNRSPLTTFAGQKRARLRVKGLEPPVGGSFAPDQVRFLLYRGSSPPAVGAMYSQGLTTAVGGVIPQQLITAPDFSTATHDAATNTFPAGLPSTLLAAIGGFMIDAASDGSLGDGTFREDAHDAAWEDIGAKAPYQDMVKTAAQAITDSTWTTVTWTSSNDGPNGGMSGVGGVFTVPIAGRYRCHARITWAGNATGRREMRIMKNGANSLDWDIKYAPSTADETMHVEAEVYLAAGDTIEFQGWQNSGANRNIAPVGQQARGNNHMAISYLGR